MAIERVVCNLCGADHTSVLFECRDRLHGKDGTFSLVRCRRCRLIYLNPRPTREELVRFYPEEYEPYSQAIEDEPSTLRRFLLRYGVRRRCHTITSRKRGGRLLDVGAATGIFLAEMAHHGDWELHGVEINSKAARYARDRFGLRIFCGELGKAEYPDGYFDVITLWDVLEHLPDPRSTLLEVERIVKPDGLLVLQVPDAESLEAGIFGQFWIGLDIPRHLYVFTKGSLSSLLDHAGFIISGIEYLATGYHTFRMSLGLVIDEKIRREEIRRGLKRALGSLPAQILTSPIFASTRWLKRGAVMTVLARTRDGYVSLHISGERSSNSVHPAKRHLTNV